MNNAQHPSTRVGGEPIADRTAGYLLWWASRSALRRKEPQTLRAVLLELGNRIEKIGPERLADLLIQEAIEGAAIMKARRKAAAAEWREQQARTNAARQQAAREARQARLAEWRRLAQEVR